MKNRKFKAILISPLIGSLAISVFIGGYFLIDILFNRQFDGSGISIFSYYFLLILIVLFAFSFQLLILEPIFYLLKKQNKLNRETLTPLFIILDIVLSSIIILFWDFSDSNILVDFLEICLFWMMFLIPCLIANYNIYIKWLSPSGTKLW